MVEHRAEQFGNFGVFFLVRIKHRVHIPYLNFSTTVCVRVAADSESRTIRVNVTRDQWYILGDPFRFNYAHEL